MPEKITIVLEEEDAALLKELASMEDCTESEFVAKALHFWTENL